MKPSFPSISVRQSLRKLGEDIRQARLVRRIPMSLLAERAMISRATLAKIQNGDPSVAMGSYAQVIFCLGFRTPFMMMLDITNDPTALSILGREIPQRVRLPKEDVWVRDTNWDSSEVLVCEDCAEDSPGEPSPTEGKDNGLK